MANIKRAYFIGIGGIGMSAIARHFSHKGIQVFGYDKTETALTRQLSKEGMHIHYQENVERIPAGIDVVIYTPAIPETHAELRFFRSSANVPVMKRAAALGIISRDKKTIAIAGTHGKTTTTALLTYLLKSGGVDCTAFLGGIAENFQTNYVAGQSEWIVLEADEYDRSFLHIAPHHAAILSMDADHLDIYGNQQNLHDTGFLAFADKVDEKGKLFVQHDWVDYLQDKENVFSYGIEKGTWQAQNIQVKNGFFHFDFTGLGINWKNLKTGMPGRHNIENAVVAMAISVQLGVGEESIRRSLEEFKGIKRRFEIIYRDEQIVYIDDYAHHPTELKAVINAVRELFPGKTITGVFQPHLFSRTRDFAREFAAALDLLDRPVVLDIYPARELPIEGVDAGLITKFMQHPQKEIVNKSNLIKIIERLGTDILLTLGAGDIGVEVEKIKQYFSNKAK